MTLIAVYTNDGCVGRCDAKCYEADSPPHECDCICGGMNHGGGQRRAEDNTRKYYEEWSERFIRENGIMDARREVCGDLFQLNLF